MSSSSGSSSGGGGSGSGGSSGDASRSSVPGNGNGNDNGAATNNGGVAAASINGGGLFPSAGTPSSINMNLNMGMGMNGIQNNTALANAMASASQMQAAAGWTDALAALKQQHQQLQQQQQQHHNRDQLPPSPQSQLNALLGAKRSNLMMVTGGNNGFSPSLSGIPDGSNKRLKIDTTTNNAIAAMLNAGNIINSNGNINGNMANSINSIAHSNGSINSGNQLLARQQGMAAASGHAQGVMGNDNGGDHGSSSSGNQDGSGDADNSALLKRLMGLGGGLPMPKAWKRAISAPKDGASMLPDSASGNGERNNNNDDDSNQNGDGSNATHNTARHQTVLEAQQEREMMNDSAISTIARLKGGFPMPALRMHQSLDRHQLQCTKANLTSFQQLWKQTNEPWKQKELLWRQLHVGRITLRQDTFCNDQQQRHQQLLLLQAQQQQQQNQNMI